MRLVLVRHAQTPANVARSLDTAPPGPPLTDLGRQQADALVDAVAGECIDSLWASSALRAQQTIAPLAAARGLPVCVRAGLREVEAGALEGASDEASTRRYLGAVFAWAAGDTSVALEGSPPGEEVLARLDGVVAEIARVSPGCALAVSHGAAIRLWVAARAGNLDPEWVAHRPLLNTAIVVVEGSPGSTWTALSWAGAPVGAPGGADGPAAQPLGVPVAAPGSVAGG